MEQFLTVFATVVSGVIVYVFSEYVKAKWLDVHKRYMQLKYDISYLLCMYAYIYMNPEDPAKHSNGLPESYIKVQNELREMASKLRAFIELMPHFHPGIPCSKDIHDASDELIGLSNGLTLSYDTPSETNVMEEHIKLNKTAAYEIRRLLRIYPVNTNHQKKH
ncbi:MAG: hypothetical protein ACOYI3_04790 [Christensenellales bacterium]|jgi:hypothetical protein